MWLWDSVPPYKRWLIGRAVRAARKIQGPELVKAVQGDRGIVSPEGIPLTIKNADQYLGVVEAPQWLVDRMEALRKLPPPTLLQVRRQFKYGAIQVAVYQDNMKRQGRCYDCGNKLAACNCPTRLDEVGICPRCCEAHLECTCPLLPHT